MLRISIFLKQVIVTGTVGDYISRHAPGFDDISFSNNTCDELYTGSNNYYGLSWDQMIINIIIIITEYLYRIKTSAIYKIFT